MYYVTNLVMNVEASSSGTIDILVVVDTAKVKQKYVPGRDMNNPTPIPHDSQFMIGYSPRGIISGQGTGDLVFNAWVDDDVNYRGMSIEANSDDAVIVYGVTHCAGDYVFGQNPWACKIVTRNQAVQPDPTHSAAGGLPPKLVSQSFSKYTNTIATGGTESFWISFALFTLKAGQTQELYGYYKWDPKIIVPKM